MKRKKRGWQTWDDAWAHYLYKLGWDHGAAAMAADFWWQRKTRRKKR